MRKNETTPSTQKELNVATATAPDQTKKRSGSQIHKDILALLRKDTERFPDGMKLTSNTFKTILLTENLVTALEFTGTMPLDILKKAVNPEHGGFMVMDDTTNPTTYIFRRPVFKDPTATSTATQPKLPFPEIAAPEVANNNGTLHMLRQEVYRQGKMLELLMAHFKLAIPDIPKGSELPLRVEEGRIVVTPTAGIKFR